MPSAADDCWKQRSSDSSHWAEESGDKAARLAFRQMATAWAGLAFSQDFILPTHELVDLTGSESSQAAPAENTASPHTENEEIVPVGNPERRSGEARSRRLAPVQTTHPGNPNRFPCSRPSRSYCRPMNWLT